MTSHEARKPIIHINPCPGGLGNRMIQYMAARALAAGGLARISNAAIPDWGIFLPAIEQEAARKLSIPPLRDNNKLDMPKLRDQLAAGEIDRIDLGAYCQNIGNLLDPAAYETDFPENPAIPGFGADKLLINIRGAEIFSAVHQDYPIIPAAFYRFIVEKTGLSPVFMGQITDNIFVNNLKEIFPRAEFFPSKGPVNDFHTIKNSKNIAVSISTFSWAAAWLSHAEKIFLPLSGFLNPFQRPDIDLIPIHDSRYEFFLFPANYAVNLAGLTNSHARLEGLWRGISAADLEKLRGDWPRFAAPPDLLRQNFDEAFYLSEYPDVKAGVESGAFASGFQHYRMHGEKETRAPFKLDHAWYCTEYPIAAVEIGQGDFLSAFHHYVQTGRSRGYFPFRPPSPPQTEPAIPQ